ncbi:MAG: GNAT family N-acetyltransferase [Pseudomonadota bacterium]
MAHDDIILGSPAQAGAVRRAHALYRLIGHDPRFAFQGRTVSHVGLSDEAVAVTADIARLLGYASINFAPREAAPDIAAAFQSAGLTPTGYDQYLGYGDAIEKSRAFLDAYETPDGLELRQVGADTPDATVRKIAQASLDRGVIPIPGSVMRGDTLRCSYLYVTDPAGDIVASGGGVMCFHADNPHATVASWGMLATDPAWRGKRLACWVGAAAILDLATRFGATGFTTGVSADNPASQAMCTRLGVVRSDYVYAAALDPVLTGGKKLTR